PLNRPDPPGDAADSTRDERSGSLRESRGSTLLTFPTARPVPEWRKQLSQKVRELQEQRAREAADAAAAAQSNETVTCSLPSAQLELVPDREAAVMNPIVSKVLERLERAHKSDSGFRTAATAAAPALAPAGNQAPEPETSIVPEPETN